MVHETRWDPNRRRFVADFSCTELGALSPQDGPAWKQALAVASAAYDDMHPAVVPGAALFAGCTGDDASGAQSPDGRNPRSLPRKVGSKHCLFDWTGAILGCW
jgi:hypothetical protein